MNREIKFRAYIKNNERVPSETSKIVDVKSLHLGSRKAIIGYSQSKTSYGNYSVPFEDLELMQSTGLKDKNGVEIYEGDILQEVGSDEKAKVEWSDEDAMFVLISDNVQSNFANEYSKDWEVIGNIYDNGY